MNLSQHAREAFPHRELLEAAVRPLLIKMGDHLVTLTVERQIFSERERYTQKQSVDDALLSSSVIDKVSNQIKVICSKPGNEYVYDYIRILQDNLNQLNEIAINFCDQYGRLSQSVEDTLVFLNTYIPLADSDNAHAMYLSSDNWPFSVFQGVLSEISKNYPDPGEFQKILSGGIIDIRTKIHQIAGNYVLVDTLKEHVSDAMRRDCLIDEELWMPLLLFPFAKHGDSKTCSHNPSKLIDDRPQSSIVEAYDILYHSRYLYDAFEYFGFYGFIRNAIAETIHQLAIKHKLSELDAISKYITLYQFNFCGESLKKLEG